MFDLENLRKKLPAEIEIHAENIRSEEDKFIAFYHQKSRFIYKVNIIVKDAYIFLDFQTVYQKKSFNHERRIEMSYIAHAMKEAIQHTSTYRVKLIAGLSKITWDWLIIEDIEAYKKRRGRAFTYSKKSAVIDLFESSILHAKKEEIDMRYGYDLFLCGEDGFHLFDLLDELGIAKIEEKRKVDIKIEFTPNYLSGRRMFVENMVSGFKDMGYQVHFYPKKTT